MRTWANPVPQQTQMDALAHLFQGSETGKDF